MKPLKVTATIVLLLTEVLLFNCVSNYPDQAGNISQTGNGMVAGVIHNAGGSYAKNIGVHIRKKSFLPDASRLGLAKRLADTASVMTNDSGRFAFDTTIALGTYVIEAANGTNGVLIDSVVIKSKDSTITLPPDTLKPMGVIKGKITLPEGGDPSKVFVLAYGIDRAAHVQSDSTFTFPDLAEGTYTLKLFSTINNSGVIDTGKIKVTAAETTAVGTINLDSIIIPTPKNLSFSYDTLNQLVTLTWNRYDTALVKGVNVYRSNTGPDSAFPAPLNRNPVTDTVFVDSTGEQDLAYDYRIAAVGKNGVEGGKGAATAVKIASNFVLDTVYDWYTPDMAFAKNGDMYILAGKPTLQVFDSTMRLKREWNTTASGSSIGIDERGLIFVSTGETIFVLDSTSTVVNTITYKASSQEIVRGGIKAKDSLIFALEYSIPESINVFSYQGIRQHARAVGNSGSSAWGPEFHSHLMMGFSNEILVSTLTQIISYDYSGNKVSEMALPDGANFRGCFSFDEERQLFYFVTKGLLGGTPNRFAYNTLYVRNSKNTIIAMYKIPYNVLSMPDELWVHKNGTVYLSGLGVGTCKLKPLFH
jgi:hypothetical protein